MIEQNRPCQHTGAPSVSLPGQENAVIADFLTGLRRRRRLRDPYFQRMIGPQDGA